MIFFSSSRSARTILCSGVMITALILSACRSADTTYYHLAPVPGATIAAGTLTAERIPAVIEVRTPSIVQAYDRDMIVRGNQNYALKIETDASWGEPIGEMIGHVLAANLAQRLPGKVVFSQNDSVAATPQAVLELSITSFGMDEKGYDKIEGILSVSRKDQFHPLALSVPVRWVSSQPAPGGAVGFVSTMSAGVSALADQAVLLLQR